MARVKEMPDDVKLACLSLVRGYARRREEYRISRERIEAGSSMDVYITLEQLETNPETRRMRAVEYAAGRIGSDLPADQRDRLVNAIFTSCIRGRKAPFEKLNVVGMERTCFYTRRAKFLREIAAYMDMI